MDVGTRLRVLRTGLRVSGSALAKMAGVAQSTISEIESGQTVPSIRLLNRLCQAMGISLGDFFASDQNRQPVTTAAEVQRLLMLAQQLERHQVAMICTVAEALLKQKNAGSPQAAETPSLYPMRKKKGPPTR